MDNAIKSYHDLSLELDSAIKSDATICKIVTAKGILNNSKPPTYKHETRLPDLWMGSIPKYQVIKPVEDAIVMPKFDGCSCGVRYVRTLDGTFEATKATTRGIDTSHKQQNTDILPKYLTVSSELTNALNAELHSSEPFKFENGLTLANIQSLAFRGEIVALDKSLIETAAAPYISGKVNGGMEVWNNALSNICFIPYEIMNIVITDETYRRLHPTDDKDESDTLKPISKPISSDIPEYVAKSETNIIDPTLLRGSMFTPSQGEVINFLYHMNQLPFEVFEDITLLSDDISLTTICEYYMHFQETITQPVDGVVYCSATWRYPQHKSETTDTNYTKYAWKPTSESTTRLTRVEYNIARDGKIGLITCYEPIRMNGRTFTQCKTAPTRMNKLDGIGIGSVITIELCKDISPQIKEFEENESITPYALPTKCPFCKSKITRKDGKSKGDVKVTLTCSNPSCPEKLIQKYKYLLTQLGIKGIAEGKLRSLKTGLCCNNIVSNYLTTDPDKLTNALCGVTLKSFLLGIGYGTTSQINKATAEVNNLDLMVNLFDNFVKPMFAKATDPFIQDVINYIDNSCFE